MVIAASDDGGIVEGVGERGTVIGNLSDRIAALGRDEPALTEDLALRGALIAVLDGADSQSEVVVIPADRVRAKLQRGVPLLHGEALSVPSSCLRLFDRLSVVWLADPIMRGPAERLLTAARDHTLHPEQVLNEALASHDDHLEDLANAAEIAPILLVSIADLTTRPWLTGLANRLRPALSLAEWDRGYCPICGAWPTLAEQDGSAARLRCGRCLTTWAWTLPACPYCQSGILSTVGSTDLPGLGVWHADGCVSCRRYLKVAASPQTDRLAESLVNELETWKLDRAAIGQGLSRPEGSGYRLELLGEGDVAEDDGFDDD